VFSLISNVDSKQCTVSKPVSQNGDVIEQRINTSRFKSLSDIKTAVVYCHAVACGTASKRYS